MRYAALLAAILPLVYGAPALSPRAGRAPVLYPRAGQAVPGKWIVKMNNDVLEDIVEEALKFLTKEPSHRYGFASYKGFAAEISDDIVDILSNLPGVDYIEQDAIIKANLGTISKRAPTTQDDATWGLARISAQEPGATEYTYDDTAGEGTCVYIIDTGVEADHPEFEGRATFLENFTEDGDDTDGNGHGTHCAGTIGSKSYGVAKKTSLFGVKVLDAEGSGTNSGVIAGINYAANDHTDRSECSGGAVGSMSLGGSQSAAVNSAAANAVSAGLFLAVAAGNDGADAKDYSPASEPTAFTVGATDSEDQIADFSNFGELVDAFAPGVEILSTWIGGETNTISGTSMATPHVAGLAAYLLALEGNKDPAALGERIIELANKDKINGLPDGTANNLIFNGISSNSTLRRRF